MQLAPTKAKGVYVDLRDREGARKRVCFTVYEATPEEVARLLRKAIAARNRGGARNGKPRR